MNLLITNLCNRACPYCFAQLKLRQEGAAAHAISSEMYDRYLDFVQSSNLPLVKLLGGEPSLHPEFVSFILRALDRGLDVSVFTNGMWPDQVIDEMPAICSRDGVSVSFIFNVNEPAFAKNGEEEYLARSMPIVGKLGSCGFNIFHDQFDTDFIVELVDKYGLARHVRLGLASPIFGVDSNFAELDHLKCIGKRLVSQLDKLERNDVLGCFDCGFPLCMFNEKDLGRLTITTKGFSSICDFPIDVGHDLSVWPCFPLSNIKSRKGLADFSNHQEIKDFFYKKLRPFMAVGTREECLECRFLKRGQCCGGCVSHTLRNWGAGESDRILARLQ